MSSVARFSLKDCHGVSYDYEVTRFSVDRNARLQLLLGEPLLRAIANAVSVLSPVLGTDELKAAMDGGTLQSLAKGLAGANWAGAADVLVPLPKMILAQGGPELIADIMSQTVRLVPIKAMQDQPAPVLSESSVPSKHLRQELGNADHRDAAYGGGNMGEYWAAAAMVLIANFTPSGPDGSVSWKSGLKSLTGGLLVL